MRHSLSQLQLANTDRSLLFICTTSAQTNQTPHVKKIENDARAQEILNSLALRVRTLAIPLLTAAMATRTQKDHVLHEHVYRHCVTGTTPTMELGTLIRLMIEMDSFDTVWMFA